MKSLLAVVLFVLLLAGKPIQDETVYICVSDGAVAYHQKLACNGLQRCTHKIIKTVKSTAIKKYKLRACKKCY